MIVTLYILVYIYMISSFTILCLKYAIFLNTIFFYLKHLKYFYFNYSKCFFKKLLVNHIVLIKILLHRLKFYLLTLLHIKHKVKRKLNYISRSIPYITVSFTNYNKSFSTLIFIS